MSTTTAIRDESFLGQLPKLRQVQGEVYAALITHGPCTTRQLAERCGISIFTTRPRVCELVDLGMAGLSGRDGREGVYRAFTQEEISETLATEAAARPAATQGELL